MYARNSKENQPNITPMKVLFTFGGLPHYYNYVLNQLKDINNIEVHVLISMKKLNMNNSTKTDLFIK